MNDRRIRTRYGGFTSETGDFIRSWPYTLGPHPDPIHHHVSHLKSYTRLQYMVDTTGFLQNDFNPCYHDRYVGVHNFPFANSWYSHYDGWHAQSTTFRRSLDDPIASCRTLPIPYGTWLEDFSARAEHHFITLVSTDYSLLNFIIELIEVLEGNARVLDDLGRRIARCIENFFDLYKKTGDFWLSWNFGIKPFIKDFKAMFDTLERAEKRLKWLRSRNHKDTKIKYREGPREFTFTAPFKYSELNISQPYYIPEPETFGDPPAWPEYPDWLELLQEVEADCTAEMRLSAWAWIRFDIDDAYFVDFGPALAIVYAAMQGLYNPLAVAWEAVPFSWLVDWCRTEAHRLRELRKSDLNPLGEARILSVGWTVKLDVLGTYYSCQGMFTPHFDFELPPARSDWQRTEAGRFRYRLYNRQPGLPEIGGSPFRVPFSWYQSSILAALINQKVRRG